MQALKGHSHTLTAIGYTCAYIHLHTHICIQEPTHTGKPAQGHTHTQSPSPHEYSHVNTQLNGKVKPHQTGRRGEGRMQVVYVGVGLRGKEGTPGAENQGPFFLPAN